MATMPPVAATGSRAFHVATEQFEELHLSIGDLSQRTAVNIETIRYYERIKLLPRPPRGKGGHRVFDAASCRRLGFIKRCREFGFVIEDIRTLIAFRDGNGACADVRVVAARHLEALRAKMKDMADLEATLAETIARCPDDDSTNCPVIQKLDGGSCCRSA
jgi:MerR family mercuric resistance operon transcriptional regulator